jgi:hypothetical protein
MAVEGGMVKTTVGDKAKCMEWPGGGAECEGLVTEERSAMGLRGQTQRAVHAARRGSARRHSSKLMYSCWKSGQTSSMNTSKLGPEGRMGRRRSGCGSVSSVNLVTRNTKIADYNRSYKSRARGVTPNLTSGVFKIVSLICRCQ